VTQARVLRQAPILFASNLGDTITYWRDKLGFEQHGVFGEPPEFAIMEYGNAFVMLKQAPKGHAIIPYWVTRLFPTGRSAKVYGMPISGLTTWKRCSRI